MIDVGYVRPSPSGKHDSNKSYRKLQMVSAEDGYYIAKQEVPIGTDIHNEVFWDSVAKSITGPQGPPGQQGLQGAQGPKGDPGKNGDPVAMTLAPGMIAMHVDERGHLILTHNDNEPAPPLSIVNGRLVYTIR